MSTIDERYQEKFSKSAAAYARAREIFPSGVTHDSRYLRPFPPYVAEAKGAYKWTVEGHRLIDFAMGHGSLLLGHADPDTVAAVQAQVAKGTHFGACHELELDWAQLVQEMVPGAERVRFTASGTEATLMAMRLARAFTGKTKILKFAGHFHGWHDYATAGVTPPYDIPSSVGIPAAVLATVLVCDPEAAALEAMLRKEPDIAAVILEPNGGSWGSIPFANGFHRRLRQLCDQYGIILIVDEVVAGFRMAPGGGQEFYGFRGDLMTYAKVLAGGLPGGCVAGRRDLMDRIAFQDEPERDRKRRIAHPGTYNANPLSAAAGIACLRQVKSGVPSRRAGELGLMMIAALNRVLGEAGVPGCCYGEGSMFHLLLGEACPDREACQGRCTAAAARLAGGKSAAYLGPLRRAMLVEGVDLFGNGGLLSVAHTAADVEFTAEAFARSLAALQAEGIL